mmetsp:Transcript_22367/g.31298  ORF Transcript_22367/g.31298 Transcript_22367/m.31298 type:complete len:125 (+) Transcript_22367:159-533(+)
MCAYACARECIEYVEIIVAVSRTGPLFPEHVGTWTGESFEEGENYKSCLEYVLCISNHTPGTANTGLAKNVVTRSEDNFWRKNFFVKCLIILSSSCLQRASPERCCIEIHCHQISVVSLTNLPC